MNWSIDEFVCVYVCYKILYLELESVQAAQFT